MIDKNGLYVQQNFDTGDAAHRTGLAYATKGLLGEDTTDLAFALRTLRHTPGVYVRHPEGTQAWHSNPRCLSRDQASRLVLGFAVNGDKQELKSWFTQMRKRFFFHQNDRTYDTNQPQTPDIMAPGELRNLIRGLNLWFLYPVLVLLDALFLVDIATRKSWDGGSLYVPDIFFACKKYPTPFAHLAKSITLKDASYLEILNNHDPRNNGCVELQELFKKLYKVD